MCEDDRVLSYVEGSLRNAAIYKCFINRSAVIIVQLSMIYPDVYLNSGLSDLSSAIKVAMILHQSSVRSQSFHDV